MDWGFLSFLAEPWFVIPWYAIGVAGFFVVSGDIRRHNTPLKKAMKWAWPIIIFFFSIIGLALYYGTARAPGIDKKKGMDAKKQAHMEYEKNMFRRVNGAVIHCVAGDGLGIMTAMVIARAVEMSFWQEFWFEYLVGFLFGWFIFQFRSMMMMTDSKTKALMMAFRAEFWSMLTVMAGMGAVMGYITPLAVTEQPKPLTYAFWGFGMLGLLLGYVMTWPMNYLMVKLGWKHGMGGMQQGEKQKLKKPEPRRGVMAAMTAMGIAALIFPAWLVEVRDGTPIRDAQSASPASTSTGVGLAQSLSAGLRYLNQDQRSKGAHAIDAAHRAASVAKHASRSGTFNEVLHKVEAARHHLHMGQERQARDKLATAAQMAMSIGKRGQARPKQPRRFGSATVLNSHGVEIGEILDVRPDRVRIALGGIRNLWGFLDIGSDRTVELPTEAVAAGPSRTIGKSLVAIPEPGEAT